MTGAATEEGATALADMVATLTQQLPDGITATVILCAGDAKRFQVAVAGSTHPELLRLVLRTALERLERQLAGAANEDDEDEDPQPCTDPRGHSWVIQDTEEIEGEGRSYCEWCGADGDA